MSDIFEEISKEVQQEKWLSLWRRYQKQINTFGICVLVVAALGWYWQYRQTEITLEASNAYSDAILYVDMGKPDRALHSLEGIPQKSGHAYVELTGLLGGTILQEMADKQGAATAYENVVKNASSETMKDLALLKLLYLQADSGAYEEVLTRISPLVEKNSVWRPLALELKAFVLRQLGKEEEAQQILRDLASNGSPAVATRVSLEMSAL